ncbi:D-cysteine desulfhydrase/L-cysteate sulfo-lyase [Angulomicrobium tetraedrale]|uniref:D-cysteine desulfhydrase/L-cysteate sulfo-lyase n=1 Tax=Ancylobacter tetraedralis TaxID=217068 RepID=A0A839ZG59_9HYPH|nr:D-cysteine desulfhydrase family protein [Ancylobacter tetraedralis]MBB3773552.1 D-cysteine desulfhydrase/L-cysteate sulfo-lyase [Ancylobacter tetraedralis]
MSTAADIVSRLETLPRLRAMHGPTPLEEAHALSHHLGGPRIFIKRDDLTAAGLGGNKVRKLEFILGRAVAEGYDTVIVCGGYQSNLARIAAAMGARAGLRIELVLGGVPGEPHPICGNLLLDYLLGAQVHLVETEPRWDFGTVIEDLAARLAREGRRAMIMPLGGSNPQGMAGYIMATAEMMTQFAENDIAPEHLFVAVGSGGTYSGLALGECNLNPGYHVTGVSVSRRTDYLLDKVTAETVEAREVLGLPHVPAAQALTLIDDQIGAHYGAPTEAAREAIHLLARLEGVFVDPVYSAKCLAGLIDQIRSGRIGRQETVVFLHTGGSPALFAYDPAVLLPDIAA